MRQNPNGRAISNSKGGWKCSLLLDDHTLSQRSSPLLKGERRGIDIGERFAVSAILPHLALSTLLYQTFLMNNTSEAVSNLPKHHCRKLQRWNSNSGPSVSKPIFILLYHAPCTPSILLQQKRHVLKNKTCAMWLFS